MTASSEVIAKISEQLRYAPDVFLLVNAIESLAQSDQISFAVFLAGGAGQKFQQSHNLTLEDAHDLARSAANLVVVVGAGFQNWGVLLPLIARIDPAERAEVVMLAPTGPDAMSQASLAQFIVETGIRTQAFGLSGEIRTVGMCNTAELAAIGLEQPRFATSLGHVLGDLTPRDGGKVAVLAFSGRLVVPTRKADHAPMFTVLTRTQGTRMETLREVMLCLSAQSVGDFEHLIVPHNAKLEAVAEIRAVIADQSGWLRSRIRLNEVHGGNRTAPLNAGFAMAKGRYVIILDDDDIVFANWLETFRGIARKKPGALLRAVAVRQEFTWTTVGGKRAARATSAMHRDYPPSFDFFGHLEESHTPPVSIAFPRYLFANHDVRFDETLTTTEDWDYIMRGAARVGVGGSEEITCIYRWWVAAENSRTMHSQSEWGENHCRIQEKIDAGVNLLEAGSMRKFCNISDKMNEYLRWANKLHHDLLDIQAATNASDIEQAKQKIASLSLSFQGEFAAMLKNNPAVTMPLTPPNNDLLPAPQLSWWQRLLGKPGALAQMRVRQRRAVIEASDIFDPEWYLATYPDVAGFKPDMLSHFVQYGSQELRSPSAQFDARNYYATNTDAHNNRIEPVFHFLIYGQREGLPELGRS